MHNSSRWLRCALLVTFIVMQNAHQGEASVSFLVVGGGEVLVGRSARAEQGRCAILVNHRGIRRVGDAQFPNGEARPLLGQGWVSRLGSVTFNLHGAGYPMGGMNERGLVVEALRLDSTAEPHTSTRSILRPLAWVQRLLDNCETVADVMRYATTTTTLDAISYHFHVADSTGASAIIEFESGRPIPRTGDDLPTSVLTSDPYAASLALAPSSPIPSGDARDATSMPFATFRRVASLVRDAPAEGGQRNFIDYALHILESVPEQGGTQWSVLYDLRRRRVYFRSPMRPNVKRIDMTKLNLTCAPHVVALDIEQRPSGDVSRRLAPYTTEWNRMQLTGSLGGPMGVAPVLMAEIESLMRAANVGPCDGEN